MQGGIIHLLPDHVANQIAAGEVVQRPASVVKELLENAIDAKATEIKLIIKDAGKTLIQVIDNGTGMNITDARMCFERHATSKIRYAEDLFELHTKGFRGEALASIAAVAHVELHTKQEQEELGIHIVIEGSKFVKQEPIVTPKGTSFLIKNLFFNIPARRNFLKSDTVELKNIMDEFHRVALAHPGIQFTMYHNGNEVFNLPSSKLRQRIVNLFGQKINDRLVPVEEKTDMVHIYGFVAKPEAAKKTRGEQFFLVNDRFIKSPFLHHAILNAFEGLLKDGYQPGYFINLKVPTNTIDINIHPTKTEVKFDNESALYAILRATVKHSLGQFNVAPLLDFNRDATLDIPYHYKDKDSEVPLIQVDASYNPFSDHRSASTSRNFSSSNANNEWEKLYDDTYKQAANLTEVALESESITGNLFQTAIESALPSFQFQKKYIITHTKSGLLIINQNRAHQRILYEQFLKNITLHKAPSQKLLFPLEIHLAPAEIVLFDQVQEPLANIGFMFEGLLDGKLTISGLPTEVTESEVYQLFEMLWVSLHSEFADDGFSLTDRIAKTLAKSLALKTGQYLTATEQENLISTLFSCKEHQVSPFLKPIFAQFTTEEIEKLF